VLNRIESLPHMLRWPRRTTGVLRAINVQFRELKFA